MKIVYEFPERECTREEYLLQILYFDRWRHKILWALRDIENKLKEITDGIIIVPALGKPMVICVSNFSDFTTEEIMRRLTPFLIKNKDGGLLSDK